MNSLKKVSLSVLLCFVFILAGHFVIFAEDNIVECPDIKIVIDGKSVPFNDVPISVNGRTLLPLRALLVALNVQNDDQHIIWDNNEKSVTIIKNSTKIYLKVGNTTAYVNDKPVTIDAAPVGYSKNGRTYVPARFIAESLGLGVSWDGDTKSVIIAASQEESEFDKGLKLYTAGDYQGAIQSMDKIILINPKNGVAYITRGSALIALKKFDDALSSIDAGIQLDPNNSLGYYVEGNYYSALGNFADGIKCYDKAIELGPTTYIVYREKAAALSGLKKYSEAIQCLDKAIQIKNDDPDLYNMRAIAFAFSGDNEKALENCEKAIELNPDNAMYYVGKYIALKSLKRDSEAAEALTKAKELDPNVVKEILNQ